MAYQHGALVSYATSNKGSDPDIITFQYNPETLTHTWTQREGEPVGAGQAPGNPVGVRGYPGESLSFTIAMDAADAIADDTPAASTAQESGVYARLAALEMLVYAVSADHPELSGKATAARGGSIPGGANGSGGMSGAGGANRPAGGPTSAAASPGGGGVRPVPVQTLPTVLFVWGKRRILPVRVTGLTVTERLYDDQLNPTHAEAQITLRVLTPDDLAADTGRLARVAQAAYRNTFDLRQKLAAEGVSHSDQSIIAMIPHQEG